MQETKETTPDATKRDAIRRIAGFLYHCAGCVIIISLYYKAFIA